MKQVKVLHIIPGFWYGGIESRLIDWYSFIDHKLVHFDVVKVTPDKPNPLVTQLKNMDANVFSIPPLGARTAFRHIRSIKDIIAHSDYDVVHSHSLGYSFFALLFAKRKGIKCRIIHSRTSRLEPDEQSYHVKKLLGKCALSYATDFFACSEIAGKWAFGENRDYRIIKNGIVLENFAFDAAKRMKMRQELGLNDRFILGFVGRFAEAKNIPFLIEILSVITKETPQILLMMVGDDVGEIADIFKKRVAELGLSQNVYLAGRQNNVSDWYQVFDLFLLPSFFEGFPAVAIEAQASGLPCLISTNVTQGVKVSKNVSFLPLGDADQWAEHILSYVDRDRQAADIESIRASGYDIKTTAEELQEFYLKFANK